LTTTPAVPATVPAGTGPVENRGDDGSPANRSGAAATTASLAWRLGRMILDNPERIPGVRSVARRIVAGDPDRLG
jgi:hypothetical protein